MKHKVIENLGYLEDCLDKYEDPAAHFQQIAKEWNASQEVPETIEVGLSEKLPDNAVTGKILDMPLLSLFMQNSRSVSFSKISSASSR